MDCFSLNSCTAGDRNQNPFSWSKNVVAHWGRSLRARRSRFLSAFPAGLSGHCWTHICIHNFTSHLTQYIVNKKHWWTGLMKRQKVGKQYHASNACSSCGLAMLKPGARDSIQVSHMRRREARAWAITYLALPTSGIHCPCFWWNEYF